MFFADSPRIYVSTNPWKISATFQTISTTREEYLSVIENLKENAPHEPKKGQKRLRTETAHLGLIKALEDRLEAIDAELVVSGFVYLRVGVSWHAVISHELHVELFSHSWH